jgi:hypothetical protein
MRREHDPLVSHIFVSRRVYHNMSGTKSDKRRHVSAWLRRQQTCDIDFGPELETGYLYCPTPFILAGSIHEKRSQLVSRFSPSPSTTTGEDWIHPLFGREEKLSSASCIFFQFPARFSFEKK